VKQLVIARPQVLHPDKRVLDFCATMVF